MHKMNSDIFIQKWHRKPRFHSKAVRLLCVFITLKNYTVEQDVIQRASVRRMIN